MREFRSLEHDWQRRLGVRRIGELKDFLKLLTDD
jgi:hypothetical protein